MATLPIEEGVVTKLNLVFLGERQSGKTALIHRILNDAPNDTSFKVSVDKSTKVIQATRGDKTLELHLIDTSGKERCRGTISSFIRHSTVFIVVYDVTDVTSFRATKMWVDVVRSEHGEDSVISLVGNKIEHRDRREVSTEDGEDLAKELKTMFIETSAVAGPNVTILFHKLVMAIGTQAEKKKKEEEKDEDEDEEEKEEEEEDEEKEEDDTWCSIS